MTKLTRLYIGLAAAMLASASAGAQLYKWVDDNGVTNYSNEPPPKSRTGKPPTIVEETISVYTPEKSVTDAIEREKERRAKAAVAPKPPVPEPPKQIAAPVPPPPPPGPIAYDPCLTANDAACRAYIYDSSPVFSGRRHPVPLNQPQLPPGAIAGQVTGSTGYIPGLSANVPPATPAARPPLRPHSTGAPMRPRGKEPERDRSWR